MVQRSLSALIQKVEEDLDEIRDEFLRIVAQDLVDSSVKFVDTGAYITSHSITTTRGAGRSRTSANKPRRQDKNFEAAQSLSQLYDDINALSKDQTMVFIANNAPHASAVEYLHGYAVYGSVRNRANYHLETAKNIVKGRP